MVRKIMYYFVIFVFTIFMRSTLCQTIYEADVNFRVDPGSKTCIFQKGKAGQMMEAYYQVLDGEHGDLDISFDIIDPKGVKILSDHKKTQNSIIMDLEVDGDYAFCLDNTYSLLNSKLVFVYIVMEDKEQKVIADNETEVAVETADGEVKEEKEVLEWSGIDEQGQKYYIEVTDIAAALSRILKHVVRARQLLDIYGAAKSRDSYLAFEDTFVVDAWSGLQISFMFIVGMLQVYMIKKLFAGPSDGYKAMY